jgi:hypothetical protein
LDSAAAAGAFSAVLAASIRSTCSMTSSPNTAPGRPVAVATGMVAEMGRRGRDGADGAAGVVVVVVVVLGRPGGFIRRGSRRPLVGGERGMGAGPFLGPLLLVLLVLPSLLLLLLCGGGGADGLGAAGKSGPNGRGGWGASSGK